MEWLTLLLGFLVGYTNAFASGGGLFALPGLILLGAGPLAAIATSRLSALSAGLTAVYRYHKQGYVDTRYLVWFGGMAVIAGVVGPRLLLSFDPALLERAVGLILLLLLPLVIWRKEMETGYRPTSRRRRTAGFGLLGLAMLYGVSIGPGSGLLYIYVLMHYFGLHMRSANATCTVFGIIGALTSLITYVASDAVDFSLGIPLLIGAAIGGYWGAHHAIGRGATYVRWVLALVIISIGSKLLFWP